MQLKRIIPIIALCFFAWVFNKPLTAVALFAYDYSGKFLQSLFAGLEETTEEATSLLEAKNKVEKLSLELEAQRLENLKLKSRLAELKPAAKQLGFKSRFSYEVIAAKVIGRSPDTWHKQVIINKGSKDGIELGRGVLSSKAIVGQVAKLGEHSAIVELIHNPDYKIGVKIKRTGQLGVLNGNYPGPGYMEFIPIDSDVQVGDWVQSSGICLTEDICPYPEGFPVGQVVEVRKDPDVVDLLVRVAFIEDLRKLKELYIIR